MNNIPLSINGSKAIDVAVKAARLSGKAIKKGFYQHKDIEVKSKNNFVSQLDLLSEQIIIDTVKSEFPDWPVISEESSPSYTGNNFTWVIDPIDGTTNSIRGIPFVCVNIALVNNDSIELGVTYDPLRNEMFTAVKGQGAFLNRKKISVSKNTSLKEALIGSDLGYVMERGKETLEIASRLWWSVLSLRFTGSAALGLAYVASGRLGIYYHRYLYPWDVASGILLIREAGGEVIDWESKSANYRSSGVIGSNAVLGKEFISFLKSSFPSLWQS